MNELCKHGAQIERPAVAWAGPTAQCACCKTWFGYFFIGGSGPPIGPEDLCDACGGMQIKGEPPTPPPKTLHERLEDYKASKRS